MEKEYELQHNQSECIQTQAHLTGTTYHNVCTGEQSFVPMGSATATLVIILIVLIGLLASSIIFD